MHDVPAGVLRLSNSRLAQIKFQTNTTAKLKKMSKFLFSVALILTLARSSCSVGLHAHKPLACFVLCRLTPILFTL
jgi:hypothetical protein